MIVIVTLKQYTYTLIYFLKKLFYIIVLDNPVPEDDDEDHGQKPPDWSWYQLLPGILVAMLYYLASSSNTIPEVPFPYFLQNMLNTGEVSGDRMYWNLRQAA